MIYKLDEIKKQFEINDESKETNLEVVTSSAF